MEEKKKPLIVGLPAEGGNGELLAFPPTDPQGMYTGVPTDPEEVPVQDVDDL